MAVQPFLSIKVGVKSKNGYTDIHSGIVCILQLETSLPINSGYFHDLTVVLSSDHTSEEFVRFRYEGNGDRLELHDIHTYSTYSHALCQMEDANDCNLGKFFLDWRTVRKVGSFFQIPSTA